MKRCIQKNYQIIKNEKGAISTLVLYTVLMFLLILTSVYFSITNKEKAQLKSDMRIQEIYGEDVKNIDDVYNNFIVSH